MTTELPPDQYDLYAQFGIAAEKAQVLEVEAGNVLLSFVLAWTELDPKRRDDREFFKGLVDDANNRTLGRLLAIVKSLGKFDEKILHAINVALERRNYLTHQFFRTHNFAILSTSGRSAMIEDLKSMQRQFDLAHTMLYGVAETLRMLGGKPDLSPDVVAQLIADGRRVDL